MAELSSFLIDAFPEAAVLARRWRVERANAMARHYLPSLQEGEPLPYPSELARRHNKLPVFPAAADGAKTALRQHGEKHVRKILFN